MQLPSLYFFRDKPTSGYKRHLNGCYHLSSKNVIRKRRMVHFVDCQQLVFFQPPSKTVQKQYSGEAMLRDGIILYKQNLRILYHHQHTQCTTILRVSVRVCGRWESVKEQTSAHPKQYLQLDKRTNGLRSLLDLFDTEQYYSAQMNQFQQLQSGISMFISL